MPQTFVVRSYRGTDRRASEGGGGYDDVYRLEILDRKVGVG
jgi:hypothetical protein